MAEQTGPPEDQEKEVNPEQSASEQHADKDQDGKPDPKEGSKKGHPPVGPRRPNLHRRLDICQD
jgi:hypothetical protein